jgi:biotin carboxyl carrier protein
MTGERPGGVSKAELAGTVVQLECSAGDVVELDDVILDMESMKMEIPVCAPCACRGAEIRVAENELVVEDQALATIEN